MSSNWDSRFLWDEEEDGDREQPRRPAPGKVTLTSRVPARRGRAQGSPPAASLDGTEYLAQPVQRRAAASAEPDVDPFAFDTMFRPVHAAAARGIESPSSALHHRDQIQASFGRHDVSHVKAHVGGDARDASAAMGAAAFATGDHVVFGDTPDLHTAAHEAAHVVQQRGGVQLKGGVGEAGDPYERHADAVADKVVRGESAESLLDELAGSSGSGSATPQIQRKNIGGTGEGQEETRWDASAERFRVEAERKGTPVTAREYLRGYMLTRIAPALSAAMAEKGFSAPHRRLAWGEKASDFGYEIVARIPDVFQDEYHGLPDLIGDEIWKLIDDNRLVTESGGTVADRLVPGRPKEGLKDGSKGPMRWVPDVAVAIVSRFDERVRESLPRVGARYVTVHDRLVEEAGDGEPRAVKSSDILPGHPMDRLVIRVVCSDGMVTVAPRKPGDATPATRGPRKPRRLKSVTWVDEPGMWNWIKVSPVDATAEEVAYHLFEDYSAAHRLVATPPFFGLTIKDAAQFPEARALRAKHSGRTGFELFDAVNESPDVTRARAAHDHDPAHDRQAQIVTSRAGDEASRAAGGRGQRDDDDMKDNTAPARGRAPAQLFDTVVTQLEALARMVAPFGLAGELAPVHERTVARRKRLPTAAPAIAEQLAGIARGQHAVLFEIGAPVAQIVAQLQARGIKASDKGPGDAARDSATGFVRAAAVSDLPEMARVELAGALKAQRLAATDAMEAMLADAVGRVESITMQKGRVLSEHKRSEKVMGADLYTRQRALRVKVAELRGRFVAGEPVSPAELQAIFEQIDALRFEAELMVNIASLEGMFEAVNETLSDGWIRAAENTPFMGSDLASIEEGGSELKSTLTRAHKQWLEIQGELRATKQSDPERVAELNESLQAIKDKVHALAGSKAVAAYLNAAYERMSDARTKAAIVQIAFFVGISIAAAGVGGFVGGLVNAARGAETTALLGHLAGMTVESAIIGGANVATNRDTDFGTELAADFVGNLVTFGALRGVDSAIKAQRIAKNIDQAPATLKAAYGTMHASLKGGTILATQGFSMQVDAAIHGESLSADDLIDAGPKALGMMIGHTAGARLLARPLEDLQALGARGGELIRRRKALRDRSQILRKTGDPEAALRLLADERALYEAEVAALQSTLRDKGGWDPELQERIKGSQERLRDVDAERAGHAVAQMRLEPVVPGHSYTGTPDDVDGVVAHYRSLGFTVEEFPNGAGAGKRLIELTSPAAGTRLELLDNKVAGVAAGRRRGPDKDERVDAEDATTEAPPTSSHRRRRKDPPGDDGEPGNRGAPYRDWNEPDGERHPKAHTPRRQLLVYDDLAPRRTWADIARAEAAGELSIAIGRKLDNVDDGHAVLAKLATGDITALRDIGIHDFPPDYTPLGREWALAQVRDGYVLFAGAYDEVLASVAIRVVGHIHPMGPPSVKHGGDLTPPLELKDPVRGDTFETIIQDRRNALDSGLAPSALDIHRISDGTPHVLYTGFVHAGERRILPPKPGDRRPRVEVHLTNAHVVKTKRGGEYWYEVDAVVKDSGGAELWSNKIQVQWVASLLDGTVFFGRVVQPTPPAHDGGQP